MRYRTDIEFRCEYCRFGTEIGEGEIACIKRGIMKSGFHCSRFRYDAIKRTPERRAEKPDALRFNAAHFFNEEVIERQ